MDFFATSSALWIIDGVDLLATIVIGMLFLWLGRIGRRWSALADLSASAARDDGLIRVEGFPALIGDASSVPRGQLSAFLRNDQDLKPLPLQRVENPCHIDRESVKVDIDEGDVQQRLQVTFTLDSSSRCSSAVFWGVLQSSLDGSDEPLPSKCWCGEVEDAALHTPACGLIRPNMCKGRGDVVAHEVGLGQHVVVHVAWASTAVSNHLPAVSSHLPADSKDVASVSNALPADSTLPAATKDLPAPSSAVVSHDLPPVSDDLPPVSNELPPASDDSPPGGGREGAGADAYDVAVVVWPEESDSDVV